MTLRLNPSETTRLRLHPHTFSLLYSNFNPSISPNMSWMDFKTAQAMKAQKMNEDSRRTKHGIAQKGTGEKPNVGVDSFQVKTALNAPKKKAEGLSQVHKGSKDQAYNPNAEVVRHDDRAPAGSDQSTSYDPEDSYNPPEQSYQPPPQKSYAPPQQRSVATPPAAPVTAPENEGEEEYYEEGEVDGYEEGEEYYEEGEEYYEEGEEYYEEGEEYYEEGEEYYEEQY